MTRSTDITSLTEFRTHLRTHIDERKANGRPLFLTANGETEAVVLSAAAYDELADQADQAEMAKSLALLDRSMEDIKAGRVKSAKQAIRDIARDFALELHR
jgi:PHD/YefM family antitoxin component YafN of YafNO toxin-antitoxin module